MFLCSVVLLLSVPSRANDVVASQWVIFDANNSTEIFGNPSYRGSIGAPYVPDKLVNVMFYGLEHVIGVSSDNLAFGWGLDPSVMGLPSGPTVWLPTLLFGGATVRAAAASAYASVVVNSTGYLLYSGRLASGMSSNSSWTTVGIAGGLYPNIVAVKCGYAHCIAQASDGTLYGFGANDVNQVQPNIPLVPTPPATVTTLYPIPLASTAQLFCTGHSHTSIATTSIFATLGDCRAVRGDCAAPAGTLDVKLLPTTLVPISQLECGMYHTVLKFGVLVYAIGANDVQQVNPSLPSAFNGSFTPILVPYFGTHQIFVVGNTTTGRSGITNLVTGFGGATAATELIAAALGSASDYQRPPWLRIQSVDASAASALRYTFSVRFRESDSCAGTRPFLGAVCMPTADPANGRWVAQRSLQLGAGRQYAEIILSRRPMTVYGDFILNSNGTLAFDFPDDPDSPSLEVTGCAQVDGTLQLMLSADDIMNIRKKYGGKKTIQLIQSTCPFFAGAKRDIEVVLAEEASSSPLVAAPNSASPPPSGTVPDVAVEPTDVARSGASSSSALAASSPTATKSSSCSKTTVTTQQQSSGGISTLVAVVSVDSSACNTWWIVLTSVLGGLVIIVVIVLVTIFSVPAIRSKILPYRGSRGGV